MLGTLMTAVVLAIVLVLHRDRLQEALFELSRTLRHSRPRAVLNRRDVDGLCIVGLLFAVLILELSWVAKHL
ncbi:MAG TPA: hypothetical protein VMH28_12395 [Candidatus Acidoferrales bacterium]|nr:hypothetical protein [Candidatus Acidoferrales bacterium]